MTGNYLFVCGIKNTNYIFFFLTLKSQTHGASYQNSSGLQVVIIKIIQIFFCGYKLAQYYYDVAALIVKCFKT